MIRCISFEEAKGVCGGQGVEVGGNTVAPSASTSGGQTTLTCPKGTISVVMIEQASNEVFVACIVPRRIVPAATQ